MTGEEPLPKFFPFFFFFSSSFLSFFGTIKEMIEGREFLMQAAMLVNILGKEGKNNSTFSHTHFKKGICISLQEAYVSIH